MDGTLDMRGGPGGTLGTFAPCGIKSEPARDAHPA